MSRKWDEVLQGIKEAYDTGIVKTTEEWQYIVYYIFAEKFGWTPEQVDRLTLRELDALLMLIQLNAERTKFDLSWSDKKMLKL